jgi:hypothetical protein
MFRGFIQLAGLLAGLGPAGALISADFGSSAASFASMAGWPG